MILSLLAAVTPVGPDTQADSAFGLDAYTVTILLGLVIPLINGFVTKCSTSTTVKALITLLLSAVAGIVNVSITEGGGAIISQSTIKSTALTFLIAVTTYVGLFKPLELTSSLIVKPDENGTVVTKPGKLASVGVT